MGQTTLTSMHNKTNRGELKAKNISIGLSLKVRLKMDQWIPIQLMLTIKAKNAFGTYLNRKVTVQVGEEVHPEVKNV